jgi:SAM-dependent methyltransferase
MVEPESRITVSQDNLAKKERLRSQVTTPEITQKQALPATKSCRDFHLGERGPSSSVSLNRTIGGSTICGAAGSRARHRGRHEVAYQMLEPLKKLLAHPDTRDLTLDDPRTTQRRRGIIQRNRFLWRIYDEWYRLISASIPHGAGSVLELGSGAGFLAQYIPGLITSEVFLCSDIQLVLDGRRLPFSSGSLKAIAMVDVLHHVPDNRAFFTEAQRCLRSGGSVVMIEPWVSTWSRQIYTRLHHEPFDPEAPDWSFEGAGPLSGANQALPWIIFQRDRSAFESDFRELEINAVRPFMPFRYLVSGGVSMRQLMPEATFNLWRKLECWLCTWPHYWSMFALIHLKRR